MKADCITKASVNYLSSKLIHFYKGWENELYEKKSDILGLPSDGRKTQGKINGEQNAKTDSSENKQVYRVVISYSLQDLHSKLKWVNIFATMHVHIGCTY